MDEPYPILFSVPRNKAHNSERASPRTAALHPLRLRLPPTDRSSSSLSGDSLFLLFEQAPFPARSLLQAERAAFLLRFKSCHSLRPSLLGRTNRLPLWIETQQRISISYLDFSFCARVSDDVLASIATAARPSLLSINLSRSRSFSHFRVASLTASYMSLVEINLSNVIDLSDSPAEAIGWARNLERLWLARCKLVTDMGTGCIAMGCQKLKLLCLNWCLGLTDLESG